MRLKLFTLVLTIMTFNARAQNEDSLKIRAIADEILLHSHAYENLRVLTKQVGGRLSGSPQTYKAEAWAHKALEQAGADRVIEQACLVPHWVRGGKDEAIMPGWSTRRLDVLALGNSVGTGPKGVSAPVVLINSFEELEQKKAEVKGKIVFYNCKFNDTYVKTFEAYRDAVVYRGAGPSQAAKYGAVAVLIRSMSHAADNNPHTGSTRYNDSFPKIPAAALGLRDADGLASLIEKDVIPVSVTLKTHGKMLPDTVAHNIIGEFTGSEFPDQIITIGGHLDSWDPAEGAHDDGSGCVHSIEVLRALKAIGYKPKRTIRVVLFANEENGTRGGLKYAEEARLKKEKHIFALESDEGGFTPRGFGVTVPAEMLNKLRSWLPLLAPYGISEINNGGGGSDIGPLAKELGTPLAGLQPDSQRYFDIHHARSDVFEAVNKRELELGAVSIAALIYLVDKYGL
jgi:carboxypeptidase Q